MIVNPADSLVSGEAVRIAGAGEVSCDNETRIPAAARALAAGCSVGPKYQRPAVQAPAAFKEQPPESYKEIGRLENRNPADATFGAIGGPCSATPILNALEQQIDVSNQNLKSAEARFHQARALIRSTNRRSTPR